MTINQRIEKLNDLILEYDNAFPDSNLKKLIVDNSDFCSYLVNDGFLTAPASTKYHGAYEGGLFDHSRAVYKRLRKLTVMNDLKWQRPESPFIVGMFHDLCKCDQYRIVQEFVGDPITYEHNDRVLLKGHGEKSVMILSRFMSLTEEEVLSIRYHMGAYEKEDWTGFDLAIRKYPNVLYSHTADMLASKVDNI